MMKFLHLAKDGGKDSTVSGFWLVEIKKLFSIAFLVFHGESREAFHTHAFNSISWLLKGQLWENFLDGKGHPYFPSWRPIVTTRDTFHKVDSVGNSYIVTFRGPWIDYWQEWLPLENRAVLLTHGRKEVNV